MRDTIVWVLDCYETLLPRLGAEQLRGREQVAEAQLLKGVSQTDADLATRAVFQKIVGIAGLEEWSVELIEQSYSSALSALRGQVHDRVSGAVSDGLLVDSSSDPSRYFVTWVKDDLSSLGGFAFHCAEQLALMVCAEWLDELPGGEENCWYFLDVLVGYLGLGRVPANAGFVSGGHTDGVMSVYSYHRRGFLSEDELGISYAVAGFLAGHEFRTLAKGLSANPKTTAREAYSLLCESELRSRAVRLIGDGRPGPAHVRKPPGWLGRLIGL